MKMQGSNQKIRLGTRKSRLALIQTELVAAAFREVCPKLEIEIVPLTTKGDRILDKSLVEFGGKGAFVEEFEQAILDGTIDLAVHSAKDMPMELSEGLSIGAVLKRGDPRDVFITVKGRTIERSPEIIGTGSPRRQIQILEYMAKKGRKAECRLLRGNVNTRLEKLWAGEYDGIVLASAGLSRLGLEKDERFSYEYLPESEFVPAGGQAVIAVEARSDSPLLPLLSAINHEPTMRGLMAERRVLALLEAGCHEAVGVFSREEKGRFFCTLMAEQDGRIVKKEVSGFPWEFMALAEKLAKSVQTGLVSLVGAGPGDPGLITKKGLSALQNAEVLIYDRLVSETLLKETPDSCERIYVGKKAGAHAMAQEEINRLLVEKAKEGKRVVRLKGGDPFVFGRGGEELLELEKNQIPYEEIPGVTSAVAALAAAGIPATHRGLAESFHVITGHRARGGGEAFQKELSLYAKLPGTLVFLMGLSNLEEIISGLISGGMDPDTSAAVVSEGTLPQSRCVRAALQNLAALVRKEGLESPAILAVGKTTEFSFHGQTDGLLSGVSVGITGTDGIYERLSGQLLSYGARPVRAAVSRIKKKNEGELDSALSSLSDYGWVIFTSRNAVSIFFEALRQKRMDLRRLGGLRFAAVGRKTGEALASYGLYADYIPQSYTVQALADGLVQKLASESFEKEGKKLLIPRSELGSKALTETLTASRIPFQEISIYEIETEEPRREALLGLDYVTFASGSGVHGFFKNDREKKAELFLKTVPVCIGEATARALAEYSSVRPLIAGEYTADGILDVICNDRKHRK